MYLKSRHLETHLKRAIFSFTSSANTLTTAVLIAQYCPSQFQRDLLSNSLVVREAEQYVYMWRWAVWEECQLLLNEDALWMYYGKLTTRNV